MTIIKWDPFRNIAILQDRINKLFDDSFPCTGDAEDDLNRCSWNPPVDIYEKDEGVVITIDLPGVNKADVDVEMKDDVLTINGHRFDEENVDEEQYYRRERTCGAFQRSFTLRSVVPPESIKAKFKNGILRVEIPKPKEEKPKQVSVKID